MSAGRLNKKSLGIVMLLSDDLLPEQPAKSSPTDNNIT
ncbi:hypothetical protein ACUOA8_47055, partial [Escherichia sp. SS-MK2]